VVDVYACLSVGYNSKTAEPTYEMPFGRRTVKRLVTLFEFICAIQISLSIYLGAYLTRVRPRNPCITPHIMPS